MPSVGLGYVNTGPVPNGSNQKIVTDRHFVHTGTANYTVNPPAFPIRNPFLESPGNLPGPISVFGDKCFLAEVHFC